MFSCCRANPKSTKKDKDKSKSQQKEGNTETDEEIVKETQQQEEKDLAELQKKKDVQERKLIIPTITVENGKAIDDQDYNEDNLSTSNELLNDCLTEKETNDRFLATDIVEQDNYTLKDANINEIADSIQNDSDEQQTYSKKSTPTSCTDDSITSVSINQILETTETTTPPLLETEAVLRSFEDINMEKEEEEEEEFGKEVPEIENETKTDNQIDVKTVNEEVPAKSCLSRHNSTHSTCVKKKVNISEHTEIIEPDPLPPPPYALLMLDDTANLPRLLNSTTLNCLLGSVEYQNGDVYDEIVDDEVFSDSIPPPKRESMCAPYIDRNGKTGNWQTGEGRDGILPETIFVHGLPEWFNDERINEK